MLAVRIIIVGCGKIGENILADLTNEDHNVIAIDNDPDVISNIGNIYDVMTVCGSGTDRSVLKEARVHSAEMFIACTSSDEVNMLSCFIARKMGAQNTIARIRNPEYNLDNLGFLKEQLDLSLAINPEMLAAKEMFNVLKLPSAVKIQTFSARNFEIIELIMREGSPFAGVKLMDLRNKYKAKFLICVVSRGDKVYIPDGNFILQPGDKVGLTAEPAEIQKLMKAAGIDKKHAKNILILGGGRIAFYLSKMLTAAGMGVKIIEIDEEKCNQLSQQLPKAVIINGNGAQQELLLEEGLNSVDAFVTLTGMDEENILISIFAANHNVPTVITKVNHNTLASLATKLGLDRVISPKEIMSDVLVQYARALENTKGSNVETLYNIMDDKAVVLEFNVSSEFNCTGIPIKDLRLKPGILIAGIIRHRMAIIPTGTDYIQEKDKVIILTENRRLNDLNDILK